MRKERKYNLIIPFWAVTMTEEMIWVCEIILGIDFSNQIESSKRKARFWLMIKF